MKRFYRYFFRGLITLLPIALTLYLLYLFLGWTDRMTLWALRPLIGNFYVPGLGLVVGILVIVSIGFLVSQERVNRFMSYVELPFNSLPGIKSVYSSLKSFADYFTPGGQQQAQQVVILRIPGQPLELVGLVTRTSTRGLPEGFLPGERVGVYLPMGYMIGGYTVFVPAEWVQPIRMTVEEAMRSSLIAWMARSDPATEGNAKATTSPVAPSPPSPPPPPPPTSAP